MESRSVAALFLYAGGFALMLTAIFLPFLTEQITMEGEQNEFFDMGDTIVTIKYGAESAEVSMESETMGSFSVDTKYSDMDEMGEPGEEPKGRGLILAGFIVLSVAVGLIGLAMLTAFIALVGDDNFGQYARYSGIAAGCLGIVALILLLVGIAQLNDSSNMEESGLVVRGLRPGASTFLAGVGSILGFVGASMPIPAPRPVSPVEAETRRLKCPQCSEIFTVTAGQRPKCTRCGLGG